MSVRALLTDCLKIVDVGLQSFTQQLWSTGVAVSTIDWRPPAQGGTGAGPGAGLNVARVMDNPVIDQAPELWIESVIVVQPPRDEVCPVSAVIGVCAVLDASVEPAAITDISHHNPGVGQFGVGIADALIECFHEAPQVCPHPLPSS